MKKIFKVFKTNGYKGWRIKLGMFNLRWFGGECETKGFRLLINPTTDLWIRLLGFNQKHIGV